MKSGTAPWFTDALRRFDEIGDLSDVGRRKMPALMRGSDGRYLALTRRQVEIIRAAALALPALPHRTSQHSREQKTPHDREGKPVRRISATNLAAQLRYRARGQSTQRGSRVRAGELLSGAGGSGFSRGVAPHPRRHRSCTEATNFVVKAYGGELAPLKGHRLLSVDGVPLVVQVMGARCATRSRTMRPSR